MTSHIIIKWLKSWEHNFSSTHIGETYNLRSRGDTRDLSARAHHWPDTEKGSRVVCCGWLFPRDPISIRPEGNERPKKQFHPSLAWKAYELKWGYLWADKWGVTYGHVGVQEHIQVKGICATKEEAPSSNAINSTCILGLGYSCISRVLPSSAKEC